MSHRDESRRIVGDAFCARLQGRRRGAGRNVWRPPGGTVSGSTRGRPSPIARHLLGDLLAWGECGGRFFAVTRGRGYACGWHRDRGPEVCARVLRVSCTAIETSLIDAMRSRILPPETVGKAAERTLAKVVGKLRSRGDTSSVDRKRLAEPDVELETERLEIERRLAESVPVVVNRYALCPSLDEYAREPRAAFGRAPEPGRVILNCALRVAA